MTDSRCFGGDELGRKREGKGKVRSLDHQLTLRLWLFRRVLHLRGEHEYALEE